MNMRKSERMSTIFFADIEKSRKIMLRIGLILSEKITL
jgi:hypothetical protein